MEPGQLDEPMDYWAFETYWFYNIPDDGRIQPMGMLNDSRANSGKISEGQSARQAVVQTPIPPITLKKIKALKASGLSLKAIAKQTGVSVGKCHAVAYRGVVCAVHRLRA